jgi:hypothetical protein
LKISFNIIQDENVRLKTRIQALAADLQKKEKDMEQMMRQIQGDKVSQKTNYIESFLVNQLKKQNRALKLEMQTKVAESEQLKRNIKLAKGREAESDMQAYVEECLRMRTLLEQQIIQNELLQR